MLENMEKTISEVCGFSRDQPLVVGVSGGKDSISLLEILHRLDYSVVVGHFNHQIRDEADQDVKFIQEILGHSRITTTEKYLHIAATDISEIALKRVS